MEEHHPEGFREFGMDPDLYNEELLEEQQLHQLCFCKFGMDPDVYKAQVINKVIQDLRGLDPDATENTLNHVRTTIETVQTFSEDFFLVPKAVVLLHRFINGLSVQQMTLNVWFKNMTVAETAKNKAEQYGLPSLLFTVFVRYLLEMRLGSPYCSALFFAVSATVIFLNHTLSVICWTDNPLMNL